MIAIVTDTDANLPPETIADYQLEVAAIQILFGEDVYRERYDFSDAEAFEKMQASPIFPTTSQPPVGEFKTIYERILSKTPDATILSIHISGKLSGTVESARQAAALVAESYPDANFHIYDTLNASLGQGLMVHQAARMAHDGQSIEEILNTLDHMQNNLEVYFVLNTMENLKRGGRITNIQHLMGSLLNIKPVLSLQDGLIEAHSRQRTWKRAVSALHAMPTSAFDGNRPQRLHVGVMHAVAQEEGRALEAHIRETLNPEVLLVSTIGPGLGVHTGPGALGVCWVTLP